MEVRILGSVTHFIHLTWLQIGSFQKLISPSLGVLSGNDLEFSKKCAADLESRSPGHELFLSSGSPAKTDDTQDRRIAHKCASCR